MRRDLRQDVDTFGEFDDGNDLRARTLEFREWLAVDDVGKQTAGSGHLPPCNVGGIAVAAVRTWIEEIPRAITAIWNMQFLVVGSFQNGAVSLVGIGVAPCFRASARSALTEFVIVGELIALSLLCEECCD